MKKILSFLLAVVILFATVPIDTLAAKIDPPTNLRVLQNTDNGILLACDIPEAQVDKYSCHIYYSTDNRNWSYTYYSSMKSNTHAISRLSAREMKADTEYYIKAYFWDHRSNETSKFTKTIKVKTTPKYSYIQDGYWDTNLSDIITDSYGISIIDLDKKYAEITAIYEKAVDNGVLKIPSTISGFKVKSIDIGKWLFMKKSFSDGIPQDYIPNFSKNMVEKLIIPNGVALPDFEAGVDEDNNYGRWFSESEGNFEGFENLREVKLPEDLKEIPTRMFKDCKKLEKINIPITLRSIERGAFYNCRSLKGKLKLPKNLKYIGYGAFARCTGLTGFKIADGNKYLSQKGGVLFSKKKTHIYCYLSGKETKEYKVPSTVKTVDEYAFSETKHLKKLTLSNKMKELPYYALYKSSVKTVVLPESIKSVEYSAFRKCSKLKSLTVKNKKCKFRCGRNSADFKNSKVTVYGYKNSTAQKFAKKEHLKFVKLK